MVASTHTPVGIRLDTPISLKGLPQNLKSLSQRISWMLESMRNKKFTINLKKKKKEEEEEETASATSCLLRERLAEGWTDGN